MIGDVLSLIRTIFDIILLRKGPEAMPRAPVIFFIAVALWLLSSIGAWVTVDGYTGNTFLVGLLISFVGFIIYALLINAAGKADRIRQSLSAIIACGAVISCAVLFAEAVLPLFLGREQVSAIITIMLLWSVPVEGHIIARAIDRLWYVGLAAASTVFIVQLFLLASLGPLVDPRPPAATEVVAQPA